MRSQDKTRSLLFPSCPLTQQFLELYCYDVLFFLLSTSYFNHKALSKKHACIEVQRDLHLLYDCESKNRTRKGKVLQSPLHCVINTLKTFQLLGLSFRNERNKITVDLPEPIFLKIFLYFGITCFVCCIIHCPHQTGGFPFNLQKVHAKIFMTIALNFTFQSVLKPKVRYELKHGDMLTFGDVTCQYLMVMEEEEVSEAWRQ